jgi:hypothetical protein
VAVTATAPKHRWDTFLLSDDVELTMFHTHFHNCLDLFIRSQSRTPQPRPFNQADHFTKLRNFDRLPGGMLADQMEEDLLFLKA